MYTPVSSTELPNYKQYERFSDSGPTALWTEKLESTEYNCDIYRKLADAPCPTATSIQDKGRFAFLAWVKLRRSISSARRIVCPTTSRPRCETLSIEIQSFTWSPHSVLANPDQRPALGSSPGFTGRVQ